MNNYFFEFNIPNFVNKIDELQRVRHKYKNTIQDNIYNPIKETLDIVEHINSKIGSCNLSIAKLKNSIPYKKESDTLIVMPLWRVKDPFCFYRNDHKIERLRFTKPTLINTDCMWGCPANDSDVWLLCLHSKNSFEHIKNILQ